MDAKKTIITIKEAAAIASRSVKTIRNRLNEIPHYAGPLGIYFRRDEFERWLLQVKVLPETEYLK